MAREKFFGALDAAEYAATITSEWKMSSGDIYNVEKLCEWMDIVDGENPLDEEDDCFYYLVDENGAIGLINEEDGSVFWEAVPTYQRFSLPEPQFCPGCNTLTENDWVFCQKCGFKLR